MSAHEKGRSCARTDEVLENYRQRAIKAERELLRVKELLAGIKVDECECNGGEPCDCPDCDHADCSYRDSPYPPGPRCACRGRLMHDFRCGCACHHLKESGNG